MNARYWLSLLLLIAIFPSCKEHQQEPLYLIEKDGKIGFINSQGSIIIQPQFRSAGTFSEGLAPARSSGTYGYINTTGKWVIAPQFDYAVPFSEGLAVVYKDAIPFYINRKGEKEFEASFKELGDFKDGRALVKTVADKFGIIDRHGNLLIDTVFTAIGPYKEGLAVVENSENNYSQRADQPLKIGVIDTTGYFIIPYLKYRTIDNLLNGYFKVETPAEKGDTLDGSSVRTQFLDKTGKVVFSKSYQNNSYPAGNVSCGLIRMSLYKYWIPEEDGTSYTSSKDYVGFTNLNGKLVISDTTYTNATDFSDNRAFVEIQEGKWERYYRMIDTKGHFVSNKRFERIDDPGFSNGLAIVQVSTGNDWQYGVVDTNANFIIKPQFEEITRIKNYFVCGTTFKTDSYLYSLFTTEGLLIAKDVMSGFDRGGFRDSLLQCVMDDKLAYINNKGKIVWKQSSPRNRSVENLNIDYMNRGYFYATSTPNVNDPGGFGRSGNVAFSVAAKQSFPANMISVVVCTDSTATFQEQYKGSKVFLVNNTSLPAQFNASDSRLYMKVQALNPKGRWVDIEYLPSSWCGNSYHTLTLQPRQYWSFITPVYEGDVETKLRVQLTYLDPQITSGQIPNRREIIIYSNEYKGSINPAQFWRTNDYYRSGLMDPYLN